MIEYDLIGKDNRPVTLDNIGEVSKSIENIFPKTDEIKNSEWTRKTFGINGEAFHVYAKYQGSRIILPKKYEESIKERLGVLAELKFGIIKCQ
jgi:hypothetical protein